MSEKSVELKHWERVFLVHGACERCGWHCACPEGAQWPFCPNCKIQVMPPHPKAGEGHGDRQAYVLLPEGEALELARKQSDLPFHQPLDAVAGQGAKISL